MTSWFPNYSFGLLSEALRSIGLRIFPIKNNLIGNGDNQRRGYHPRGLVNIGNTCFMNSVLQAMSSSPSFLAHLVSLKKYCRPDSFTAILLNGLNELRDRTVSGPYSASASFPMIMKSKIQEARGIFLGNNENDAQELFTTVLELLEKERSRVLDKNFQDSLCSVIRGTSRFSIVKNKRANDALQCDRSKTVPISPYEGRLASHMKCLTCCSTTGHSGWKAVKMETFKDLSLSIPAPGSKLLQLSNSLDSSASPARVSGLFGGGMKGTHLRLPPMAVPSSIPKSSDVSLENCIELFLQSEERSEINCESCTMADVAAKFKRRSSTATTTAAAAFSKDKGDEYRTTSEECSPSSCSEKDCEDLTVDNVTLRCMSTRDCFRLDVDDEDIAEELSGSNSVLYKMLWGKDRLKVQQSMIQSTSIALFPPLLCFHLKRIVFDGRSTRKVGTRVRFPVVLDVNKFVTAPEGNGRVGQNFKREGQWTGEESGMCTTSSISGDSGDTSSVSSKSDAGTSAVAGSKQQRIADYLLRAVVVHSGSPSSGHYVAYCLVESTPRRVWAYFNDDKVDYDVDESKVLACEAYMLFYDRATTTTTSVL